MNGIIVVAPAEAQWAIRAGAELGAANLLIARLYEPRLLGMLLRGGNVRALAIDARIAPATIDVARRDGIAKSVRLLLVHEGLHGMSYGALRSSTWPTTIESVRSLIGT